MSFFLSLPEMIKIEMESLERQRKNAKLEEYERKEAEANLKAKIKEGVKAELAGIKAELLQEIRNGKKNEE